MKFEDFEINSLIKKGIKEAGYDTPTEVQSNCIPIALQGKDIIVQSRTGSGKTAGFAIPLLASMENKGIEAVVLVPTRELAVQVCTEVERLAKHTNIKPIAVYGGTGIQNQINSLDRKSIIVATPGRFIDLFKRGHLNLKTVKTVVLDEADRMLDMGFEQDIRFILSHIPKSRQTLLFSATMPMPIQRIAQTFMNNPEKLFLSKDNIDVSSIKQVYYGTSDQKKIYALVQVIEKEKPELGIIFCNTKRRVDFVERVLFKSGYNSIALHGDLSQNRRDHVIKSFKDKKIHLLVASDVAARGLDIDSVTHVINFDMPDDADVYVHRIGRTGRAGKDGKAISLVTMDDRRAFENIQRKIKKDLVREEISPDAPTPEIVIPQRSAGSGRRSQGSSYSKKRRPLRHGLKTSHKGDRRKPMRR